MGPRRSSRTRVQLHQLSLVECTLTSSPSLPLSGKDDRTVLNRMYGEEVSRERFQLTDISGKDGR